MAGLQFQCFAILEPSMGARDWELFEPQVSLFLHGKMRRWFPQVSEASITVSGKRNYVGAKGTYEIDASAEVHLTGIRLVFLVECKHWRSAVDQDTVLSLVSKIQDIGAHKGIIVAKHGFQSGAIRVARANGIALWQYKPGRRPGFHPLLMTIDWEAVAREFESRWLRRLRKFDYDGYEWECRDNVYPWGMVPLPRWLRIQALVCSFWPLWLPLLIYGALRDRVHKSRNRQ